MKSKILLSRDIGELYFGQLNVKHQAFFDKQYGQHTRIKLRDLPHYTYWRDEEYKQPSKSLYYEYLENSWNYYYPKANTDKRRKDRIKQYEKTYKDIRKKGIKEPIQLVVAPDGAKIIVSGNHRASTAYHLDLDIPYETIAISDYIYQITQNEKEFYGTKNRGVPYQSIFYKDKELVKGRRRDVLERFNKIDINDIRGKSILDTGSNVAVNAMLAWHHGAKSVAAAEFSPEIGTAALRLSTLFNASIDVLTQDLGKIIQKQEVYDTVFCFSLHAHVSNTENLEKNLVAATGSILYFEGHQRSKRSDYEHIFRHFKKTKLLGYNQDGVQNTKATRPFFICKK